MSGALTLTLAKCGHRSDERSDAFNQESVSGYGGILQIL